LPQSICANFLENLFFVCTHSRNFALRAKTNETSILLLYVCFYYSSSLDMSACEMSDGELGRGGNSRSKGSVFLLALSKLPYVDAQQVA
jgi:hypothetical protein